VLDSLRRGPQICDLEHAELRCSGVAAEPVEGDGVGAGAGAGSDAGTDAEIDAEIDADADADADTAGGVEADSGADGLTVAA